MKCNWLDIDKYRIIILLDGIVIYGSRDSPGPEHCNQYDLKDFR